MKRFFTILAVCCLLCCFAVCAFAAQESGLVAVSYRGDTTDAAPNSLGAIEAAFDAGADWVSVAVQKTSNGTFVLLEETASAQTDGVTTLEDALAAAKGKGGLILDNAWAYRDELNALIGASGAAVPVCLRTFDSAKKALQWQQESGAAVSVLPVYRGNVVMNAIAHWNALSAAKQPLVQFQSKNYFNVFYQKFTDKRFLDDADVHALTPMYDEELCGLRSDDVTGWDDLVSRGFSAIETGNIRGLAAYIAQCDAERQALDAALRSDEVAADGYSSASYDRYLAAKAEADAVLQNDRASLSQLQSAQSNLKTALRQLVPAGAHDTRKGTFRVTPGKIAVMIIFGGLLLGFDVFVYKKKKKT